MTGATDNFPTPLPPGLYIVATPIGNLGDITLRALEVLRNCDGIACEDTRVTGKLLSRLNITKPMWRYDDHCDAPVRDRLLERAASQAVVLVSDAGTPLVSDPGYRLVREARARDIALTTLPGPCAAIAGLTLSGLPSDRFIFAGFLPTKDKARREELRKLGAVQATLIFYESGPRLHKSLGAIGEELGAREVAVAREITKLHEQCRTGSATELAQYYKDAPPKGEIVLMVGPASAKDSGPVLTNEQIDALLLQALEQMKPSQAASQIARQTGENRKVLYARALEMQGR